MRVWARNGQSLLQQKENLLCTLFPVPFPPSPAAPEMTTPFHCTVDPSMVIAGLAEQLKRAVKAEAVCALMTVLLLEKSGATTVSAEALIAAGVPEDMVETVQDVYRNGTRAAFGDSEGEEEGEDPVKSLAVPVPGSANEATASG